MATAACSRSPKVRIARVRVLDRSSPEMTPRPDTNEVRRIARTALGKDWVTWTGASQPAYRLRLEYALDRAEVKERGLLRVSVLMRLESVEGVDEAPLESSGVFEHAYSAPKGLSPKSVRDQLTRAMEGVGQGLLLQVGLLLGDSARLVRALSDADPRIRDAAMRIAGIRRERKAVPRLLELLHHSEERVSDAAIGALIAIGDRRAVRPLCERFGMGDVRGLAKVIDGIASLGGDEAQAYLELLGSGHDHPEIRAMSRAALERMSRRH
jgi:hypothetical protein